MYSMGCLLCHGHKKAANHSRFSECSEFSEFYGLSYGPAIVCCQPDGCTDPENTLNCVNELQYITIIIIYTARNDKMNFDSNNFCVKNLVKIYFESFEKSIKIFNMQYFI